MIRRLMGLIASTVFGVGAALGLVLLAGRQTEAGPPLNLPSRFVDDLVTDQLLAPRAFAVTPDGRMLVLERGASSTNDQNFASVRVIDANGALLAQRALTIETCGDSERGLLGIAVDPNFSSNGFVYLYYTAQTPSGQGPACAYYTFRPPVTNSVQPPPSPGPRNRVSRFTMVGNTISAASERVLVDHIATDIGYHNAGDLEFGTDGYLYISIGDGGLSDLPQRANALNGKLLRILPFTDTATPAPSPAYSTLGNPQDLGENVYCGVTVPVTVTGWSQPCREVFASGLRNPFRFAIEPGTSTAYVGDVGGGAWEEIDAIVNGGNYGYPLREGPCAAGTLCTTAGAEPPPAIVPSTSFRNPLLSYPHTEFNANFDSAVIGGDFYLGGTEPVTVSYPAGYTDNFFYLDFARGTVWRLPPGAPQNGYGAVPVEFATGGGGIVDFKRGPSGNLCYLRYLSEERTSDLRCIRYQPAGNLAPFASAGVNPSGGPANTVYTFSAAGSGDFDNNLPLTYTWDLGDGNISATQTLTLTHVYAVTGTRIVTLTVTDSGSPPLTSNPVTVTVFPSDEPPTATLGLVNVAAPGRDRYYMHETWAFSVTSASDDNALPPNAISWEVVFHHAEHTHPFIPLLEGLAGTFETHVDEPDPDQWYRVILRVRDSVGQTTSVYQDVFPETRVYTLTTNPAGGLLVVDNVTRTVPVALSRVVGFSTTVDVPVPQIIGSGTYTFTAWSSGQPRAHTFAIPFSGGPLVANLSAVATATPTPTPTAPSVTWRVYLSALQK